MTRSIISKFIIILIVLFTALSVFWFFKTSTLKKQVLTLISASDGKISALSVSVSGFPLEQKLIIENLKFQSASNLPQLPLMPINNEYQINIKKLEAKASILSGEFKITNIEEVSLQDQNGALSSIQFNQPPQADFLVIGGELAKLSYQDAGYKVLDAGKNVLFENGNSLVNFESTIENNKYRNKVKVEFKDVEMFNSFTSLPAVGEAVLPDAQNNLQDNSQNNPQDKFEGNSQEGINLPATNVATNQEGGKLIKKSFVLDLEYVVVRSSSPVEVLTPDVQDITMDDAAITEDSKLESLNIKNFEISSPLYKININGEIFAFQEEGFPISSMSARIEKFDNILIYLKKPLSDMVPAKVSNVEATTKVKADIITKVAIDGDIAITAPEVVNNELASDPATIPVADQKPEVDVITIIKDLSKKNPATNDEIVVFDFRQEQGKDLLINETPLLEVIAQIFPSPINSAEGDNGTPPEVDPLTIQDPANPAAPEEVSAVLAIPDPAKLAPKPNNAN